MMALFAQATRVLHLSHDGLVGVVIRAVALVVIVGSEEHLFNGRQLNRFLARLYFLFLSSLN